MQVSVCICTYNRAESLRRTLASLSSQREGSWDGCELLVVDNNSRDHTASVVAAFSEVLPIRSIAELQQGLAYSRNRALAEACGRLVIFADDDVRLAPNWLSSYRSAAATFQEAVYFGGRILPEWNGSPPYWYRGEKLDLIDGLLGWYDLGEDTRRMMVADPAPFGASFAIRSELILRTGIFRVDLGVSGLQTGRGEDTEFFRRARGLEAPGVYVGNALCWHTVNADRFRLRKLFSYGVECGKAHAAIHPDAESGSNVKAALHMIRGFRQFLNGRGDRFRQSIINAGIQRGLREARGRVS